MRCNECERLSGQELVAAMYAPPEKRDTRIQQAREALQSHRREIHGHDSIVCEMGSLRRHAVEVGLGICWHYVHGNKRGIERDKAFEGVAAAMDAMSEHYRGCGCPEAAPDLSLEAEHIIRAETAKAALT